MTFILSLLLGTPRFLTPSNWIGWLGFGLFLIAIVSALFRLWQDEKIRNEKKPVLGIIRLPEPLKAFALRRSILFILLVIITPAASLFLGIRLPAWGALPMPGIAIESHGSALMVFAAIPWVFAGGILGPFAAIFIGLISGLVFGYWETNSPFTVFEIAAMAGVFSFFVQQRYRTILFRLLREPIIAALALSLIYPFLYITDNLLLGQGSFASRLDFALSSVDGATLAIGGSIFLASVFAQIIKYRFPEIWGAEKPWIPAPMETSLEKRFVFHMIPLALILIITLMASDWIIAGKVARTMLVERMQGIAEITAEGIPYFMDTGQSLITQFAQDPSLVIDNPDQFTKILEADLRGVPFFHVLFLANQDYEIIGGYPDEKMKGVDITPEEQAGIDFAYQGVVSQVYSIPPSLEERIAQVSFIAAIFDREGKTVGVLIGRVDMNVNSFTLPIINEMQNIKELDGEGMLLDEFGRIIYHTNGLRIMDPYEGELFNDATIFEAKSHDGTRNILYYQPAVGRPWSLVLSVPARRAQDLAIQIASPMLGVSIVLSLLALVILRFGLGDISLSLRKLATEADRIAQGDLDTPLVVRGNDEVGQLAQSFEAMRMKLKGRIEELNLLLDVNQSIASSMEMKDAVSPILDAVLSMGASSARIVLEPDIIPKFGSSHDVQIRFGRGKDTDLYGYLDTQILELTREQDRVFLTDPARASFLTFGVGTTPPKSLFALALKYEDCNYGAMWVVYDKSHKYTENEIRFLTTLAKQAALSASNMNLFLSAEIGRKQLAAVLSSTTDPVLVIDSDNKFTLVNPAAEEFLDKKAEIIGKSIEECITQPELLNLLKSAEDEAASSVEVMGSDGRVYMASASQIFIQDQSVGKVCVLRDITHFKELDAIKSEFVATVSHDLRSPLTLIKGYATMMDMVGDLNEQQATYNKKIITGVERMFRLINNLLDLGRIDADVGLQIEQVGIREMIERVTQNFAPQALQKRIEMIVEIDDEVTEEIEADPALLQQALYNLVDNAIRYSSLDKKVWIRAVQREDFIIFEIEDEGIGISPVDQPRVFEKFYRVEQGDNQQERGTGLGLAIVKSIAERHGGRVELKSELGKGSTFYLALPIHQPGENQSDEQDSEA